MIDISNHGDLYITINTDIASQPRLVLTFTRHDDTPDKGQVIINLLQADDLRRQLWAACHRLSTITSTQTD